MTNKYSYMLVGSFILILGVAFIWAVLWISSGGPPQKVDFYIIYMPDSVSGLNVDASLKYRGVDVGKVNKIELDPTDPERIRLVVQVRQGTPISADTVATLEYQGLTGIANVNLSGGTINSPPLLPTRGEEYPVIQGKPSIFASLGPTLSELMVNLSATSASINALLDQRNRENVANSLENMSILTERFAEQSANLERIVIHLDETLENTRIASADLPELVQKFSESATKINKMVDQVLEVGENLSSASSRIEQAVMESSDDVGDFTGSTLPQISQTVLELRRASENLRRMSEALAEDPSILIYGTPERKPGPGE